MTRRTRNNLRDIALIFTIVIGTSGALAIYLNNIAPEVMVAQAVERTNP